MVWGKPRSEWRKRTDYWFAWYPITLEDGRWCWLQTVHATHHGGYEDYYYVYTLVEETHNA